MSTARYSTSIVWLRRDLRLADNVCLAKACELSENVCIAFVVNPPLLAQKRMGAPLVSAFFDALANLRTDLRRRGSDLALLRGDFAEQLILLAKRIGARAVFFNEDYEPSAVRRDNVVRLAFKGSGLDTHAFVDHVYFGADEVVRAARHPYRIYTPYKRHWLEMRAVAPRLPVPSLPRLKGKLLLAEAIGKTEHVPMPAEFGFAVDSSYPHVSESVANRRLAEFLEPGGAVDCYREKRDLPAVDGTSFLSPQLRAGTIGIRTCVEAAFGRRNASSGIVQANIDTWISELIWRDFYQAILKHFPFVENTSFITAADRIRWEPPEHHFQAWCDGRTGYPIVDAAMRQLNETGWMHNRLRMIAASFLTKHLLIDWRFGERYFAQRLIDSDLAQNNGGWQWAASTGTDAVPYFRIFNPSTQSKQFDPDGAFIKRMIPELAQIPPRYVHEPWTMPPMIARAAGIAIGDNYPAPVVDHATARIRALGAFKAALGKGGSKGR